MKQGVSFVENCSGLAAVFLLVATIFILSACGNAPTSVATSIGTPFETLPQIRDEKRFRRVRVKNGLKNRINGSQRQPEKVA